MPEFTTGPVEIGQAALAAAGRGPATFDSTPTKGAMLTGGPVRGASGGTAMSRPTPPRGLSRRELLKGGLYGGLAAGLAPSLLVGGCSRRSRRPHVILITLDTTRADHLSCYGYSRHTSPHLDRLAAESVLYENAFASSSWTLPSHAALFTGKFTASHGARYDPEGPLRLDRAIDAPASWEVFRARGLAPEEPTLAQLLREAGYATGAVLAGPWMKKIFGLNKGFDFYDDSSISSVSGRLAPEVTRSALRWIEAREEKPLFLFLNYYDPHSPCRPPERFAWTFVPPGPDPRGRRVTLEERVALYDGEILYMDRYIGQLVKELKARGLYDNALIVVTADHGELLGEHGRFGHGNYLHQEEIHVPFFVKYPAGEVGPARSPAAVQLVDVMALLCERLELPLPDGVQAGRPPDTGHPVVAEAYPLPVLSSDGHWRALLEGRHKLLWNSEGNHQLFDLEKDPGEKENLIASQPRRAEVMMGRLNGFLESLPQPGPGPGGRVDEETSKSLESLGYL